MENSRRKEVKLCVPGRGQSTNIDKGSSGKLATRVIPVGVQSGRPSRRTRVLFQVGGMCDLQAIVGTLERMVYTTNVVRQLIRSTRLARQNPRHESPAEAGISGTIMSLRDGPPPGRADVGRQVCWSLINTDAIVTRSAGAPERHLPHWCESRH